MSWHSSALCCSAQPCSTRSIPRAILPNTCRRGAHRASTITAALLLLPTDAFLCDMRFVVFFFNGVRSTLEKDTRSAAEHSAELDTPKGPQEGEQWGSRKLWNFKEDKCKILQLEGRAHWDQTGERWTGKEPHSLTGSELRVHRAAQGNTCSASKAAQQSKGGHLHLCSADGERSAQEGRGAVGAHPEEGLKNGPKDGRALLWGRAEAVQTERRRLRGDLGAVCQYPKGSCRKGGDRY